MRSALCYVLLQVYVFVLASKPRSVNVALETTFEFNNKQDVKIIEKVRNFLSKIETVVDKKLALRAAPVQDVKYEFRDFLEELITTISSYNDNDFKEVFKTLYEEIRNQRYKRTKFNEFLDNEDLRYIIFEVLNKINQAPVQLLRVRMKKFLRSLNSTGADNQNTNFISFFNFLYKEKSPKKLKRLLTKFKRYGERSVSSELNLKEIITSTLNFLIYDHFNNLDDSIRNDVKAWLGSIRKNSHFKTTDKTLADIKRTKKENTVKSITTKKRFKNRIKKLHTTNRKTFVTLYPEAIVFNTKKKLERISPVPLWKERTVPNKNYFYLVRDSSPITDTVKDNVLDKEDANQSENMSSDSQEFIWKATNSRRKDSTKLNKQFEKQQKKTTHMSSKPIPLKSFTIENFKTYKAQESRRKVTNDDDLSSDKSSETQPNESASAKYLDRIKKLEEELNEMKKEIKAKISSATKQYTTETIKSLDEYKDFIGREEDIYLSTTSDISGVDRKYAANISEQSHSRNETSKSDAVFRSDKFNNTEDNEIFGDEFVLQDSKEVTSVDIVHSATIKPANSTLNINVSSKVVENSTIFTDHTPKSTDHTALKTETVILPVVSESDTKILTEEVNIPENITFTKMPENVESDIINSKVFSNNSSTMGYVEPIRLKL